MIVRQVVLIILTISFLTSCRHGYKVEDDSVYYEYWNESSGQGKHLIAQADAATFHTLEFDCNYSFAFGKDKNHLFIDGKVIGNIDPNSFKFIGNYIFRDKDSAYFFGFYNNINDCVIKGVNPDKIKLIKYPWAKADNVLIHGRDTVSIEGINEFVPIDDDWGKSKKYIINDNQILYDADIETFKILNPFQGKDKNYNYEFGLINEDDFKKTSYKTFDFDKKGFCEYDPIEFVDLYDSLVSYKEDQNKRIEIVEKLKIKGFTINSIRYSNWSGASKVISISMTNDKCNCGVEKLYRYDYSNQAVTEKTFKVTERVHCLPK